MKVIIAGSRSFNDYDYMKKMCDMYLPVRRDYEIVSGTANGADKLGERYAKEKGFKLTQFPADWSLGKSAGYLRNKQMAEYSDALILFWDGVSKGSKHMLDLATAQGLKIAVVKY